MEKALPVFTRVFIPRFRLDYEAIQRAIDATHPDAIEVYAQGILDGMTGTRRDPIEWLERNRTQLPL